MLQHRSKRLLLKKSGTRTALFEVRDTGPSGDFFFVDCEGESPAEKRPFDKSEVSASKQMENLLDQLHTQTRLIRDAWHAGETARLRILAGQLSSLADGSDNETVSEMAAELEAVLLAEEAEATAMCERIEALILQCKKAATTQ